MQAGVPIVPIVIKNAHDVMPRGNAILQPSIVEVVVLPPIDTSKWQKRYIDKYVRDVRQMYLDTMNQIEIKEK